MVKNLFKITIILLLVIVNSVQAQVKPTTTIYASSFSIYTEPVPIL